jgi:transcriptional regulator with XRE-family HTH domain
MSMEKLSSTLKHLLTEANISEAELARRTGIAQPMVNRLATGKNKNPKLETLKPIAKYFSVTFSQLLGEEDLPSSDDRNKQVVNYSDSQSYQVTVLEWDSVDTDNVTNEHMIPTFAKLSEKAFAVVVKNNELEPRFPQNTLLTIEPECEYTNNDFIMVKDLATNHVTLKQVITDNGETKLLNLSSNLTDSTLNQVKILGVLVQTKYDYK